MNAVIDRYSRRTDASGAKTFGKGLDLSAFRAATRNRYGDEQFSSGILVISALPPFAVEFCPFGIPVVAETTADELDAASLEMIVLPGGLRGVQTLGDSKTAMELTKQVWENGGYVAAICAAPTLLAKLGISDGRKATCYPGMEDKMGSAKMQKKSAVTDGKLITGRAAGSALDFGLALITALKGAPAAEKVAHGVVYR